ncbi:sporulation protein [Thermoflavimicrobium dichotomicum]|uniref:Sporulation-control protein n=1 Tax=Thermoflavimicrobium dichotomicum TaxID=46223 RepID=A0A1I3JCC3_9BACL|nr:sporulation protein [Thermoflavimicrobium dichotomicum]SFI57796.1 sporulation-control protein [Thermoflavimicrobium dichotomicum]
MFEKALASLGIGAAKVDTRLEKSTYRQGEQVLGEIHIQGGNTDQEIDEIYLYLVVQYHHEGTQAEYVIDEFRLSDRFVIGAHETQIIPFQFQLPYDTPVSTGGSPIYLKTGLDIKKAIDPTDLDGVEILPHPLIDQILLATEAIGFRLYQVDFDFEQFHSRNPFVQVFKLKPLGQYERLMDQLAFVFQPHEKEVSVLMQVDRKPVDLMSSMEEALDLDERLVQFDIAEEEVKNFHRLQAKLESFLKRQLD